MGFIGLVADAATTIQQETGEITRFFSIAHVKETGRFHLLVKLLLLS